MPVLVHACSIKLFLSLLKGVHMPYSILDILVLSGIHGFLTEPIFFVCVHIQFYR